MLAFFHRAQGADQILTRPDPKTGLSLEDQIAAQGIVGQARGGYSGPGANVIQTPAQQSYRQAQRAFTEARLRKESGAGIPQGEYTADAQTYFAVPGDTPAIIAQKRQARGAVLDGLKFSAGKAYGEFYGDEDASPTKTTPAGASPKKGGVYNPATGKVE